MAALDGALAAKESNFKDPIKIRNLQLRGRIWWVKKMVAGVLVHRSLETTDREEAIRRMPMMMATALTMRRRISQHNDPGEKARSLSTDQVGVR